MGKGEMMEYGIYALIALGFGAIGFGAGSLVGANNAKDVSKIVENVKNEIADRQKYIDKAKAELEKLGIKV
jgi:hypothetical protein